MMQHGKEQALDIENVIKELDHLWKRCLQNNKSQVRLPLVKAIQLFSR